MVETIDGTPAYKLSEVQGFQVQRAPGGHVGPGLGPYVTLDDPTFDEAQLRVLNEAKYQEALDATYKLKNDVKSARDALAGMNLAIVFFLES
jgi:hypothetical protein